MTVEIAGASPEQEWALRRVVAEMPSTVLQALRVERLPEGTARLAVVHPAPVDARAAWEARLVAGAFAAAARETRLARVTWLDTQSWGGSVVDHGGEQSAPSLLTDGQVERFPAAVRRAVRGTNIELHRVDVIRPYGHAAVVLLTTSEAHEALRRHLAAVLYELERWFENLGSIYLEVRDAGERPAWARGWHRGPFSSGALGGASADVRCCWWAPRGLEPSPRPRCPVFEADV